MNINWKFWRLHKLVKILLSEKKRSSGQNKTFGGIPLSKLDIMKI